MPIWGIQVMGDHHERADGHPGRPRACGRWRGVRADHGSAQPPACTHPGWGWGGWRAAGRDPPASPPSRRQMLLPGISYPGRCRTALGGGGVRQRGGRGPGPSTKRVTHSRQDPTSVNSHGQGLCARRKDSAQDARTLGRRGKQHPARSLLLTGTSHEEEV